jgi:hypothetical protein
MAKEENKPVESPRTITVDVDTLNELIDAKVRAGIATAQATARVNADDFAQTMRKVRGQDQPPTPIRHEECESPLTGARFRAKIMASRSSPLGRVIDLEDYTWPDGVTVPQSQGGRMPDEFVSAIEAPDHPAGAAVKAKYDHWKYWEFIRVDMNEFASGKPFTRYLLKSEADKRRAMDAEAAAAAQPVAAE